ncbi:VOC family protein [Paenibacillus roseipurpureus]|uniref:Glyoxalase/bleomycin resistance/dioxygenase family protein n=1 Tax=Paenibacillus roseopurpureus TaxID=2918901 RepID=A0AA96RMG9_9BACL|nr:glyoxalase/bleomycin resistance/dioxygenase family protein [Paenibacillus sp. MBLB1832]WNR44197.1 glyoxalase/bleomycin resistance/dioxygenase family protein [Paenibacillus sp. MBLB1832]
MITHFAHLQLQTVSIQGIKHFYHELLRFPISYESEQEIHVQSTAHCTISFIETAEPIAPAHFAFEVPYSVFDEVVNWVEQKPILLLHWDDGRVIDQFKTGKNVYFRDVDGNLLEIIAHPYIPKDILTASGPLHILYLREVGFPVESVINFRENLVELLDFKLDKVSDLFTFAIGGTAHAVIPSTRRKWIPIAMVALPPAMHVTFGSSDVTFIDEVERRLQQKGISYQRKAKGDLHFKIDGYHLSVCLTTFPKEALGRLGLPFSIV